MRERRKKGVIASILVLSLMFSIIPINMIVEASNSVTMDQVEMNKTIPTLKNGTKALAYVDFNYEDGISTKWTDQYYDLANNGDDKLTLTEMQGLTDSYSIVFRAKLNDRSNGTANYTGPADRTIFSVLPSGDSHRDQADGQKWSECLAVGILGGNNEANGTKHAMYYEVRKDYASTDEEAGKTVYTCTELSTGGNSYAVTRAADVSGDGDYHTIALVYTGTGFNYFVDGELLDFVDTAEFNTTYDFANIGDVFQSYSDSSAFEAWIGRFQMRNTGALVNANFDWFAFYGSALTTKQVQELSSHYEPIVEYYDDISTYRSETGYTYETKDGYTFAGWYADVKCTEPLTEAKANSATSAYAKYVSDDILRIKGQISSKDYSFTDADGETQQGRTMKFITSVDSLNYREVGFKLTKHASDGDKTRVVASNSVCTRIYAVGSSTVLKYTPQAALCEESTYFKTFTLKNMPSSDYGVEITAIPYWVTVDGTTVYGSQATKTINEGKMVSTISSSASLTVTGEQLFSIDQPWKNDSAKDIETYGYSAQGGYTDGTYFYQAFIERGLDDTSNTGTSNRVRICQYDMSGSELMNTLVEPDTSTGFSLDHANDITYNSRLDRFLISHAAPGYTEISYFILDTSSATPTLTYEKTDTIDYNIISIAYHEDTDRYVVGLKGTKAFRILDSAFHAITPELTPISNDSGYVTQGVTCDDNYVYFVLYGEGGDDYGNVIVIYDWSGNYVRTIDLESVIDSDGTTIPVVSVTANQYEPENISVIGNEIYIACNYNDDSEKYATLVSGDGLDTFVVYKITLATN